jgi:hypothetical protein
LTAYANGTLTDGQPLSAADLNGAAADARTAYTSAINAAVTTLLPITGGTLTGLVAATQTRIGDQTG